MCGKDQADAVQEMKRSRITPACAGKTVSASCTDLVAQDHPRMCGKDWKHTKQLRPWIGSPPHVRERLAQKEEEFWNMGITPACAGKTYCPSSS